MKPSKSLNDYLELLRCFGLEMNNHDPTRVSQTSATCIDHYLSLTPSKVSTVKCSISDHYGLLSECLSPQPIPVQSTGLYRDFSNLNEENLQKLLFLINHEVQKIPPCEPHTKVNSISSILLKSFDRFCPLKTCSSKKKTWMTTELKILLEKKDTLRKRMIKKCNETPQLIDI